MEREDRQNQLGKEKERVDVVGLKGKRALGKCRGPHLCQGFKNVYAPEKKHIKIGKKMKQAVPLIRKEG